MTLYDLILLRNSSAHSYDVKYNKKKLYRGASPTLQEAACRKDNLQLECYPDIVYTNTCTYKHVPTYTNKSHIVMIGSDLLVGDKVYKMMQHYK